MDNNIFLVQADAMLLEQVLYNIIENAAKYSPPASLIRVIARANCQLVSISVLDAGADVPDADLERIFDRFYRGGAGERHATGAGLGLAICRGFVEIMGGTIEAANRDGRTGATFKVTLPTAIQRELHEVER